MEEDPEDDAIDFAVPWQLISMRYEYQGDLRWVGSFGETFHELPNTTILWTKSARNAKWKCQFFLACWICFQEFRRLMLEDEWVASKLRSACEEQLKQVEWSDGTWQSGMKNA